MENVVLNRRKKTREKIVFIVLCVLIALIIIANVLAVTLAYFTDHKSGSISIRTGTVDVVGYVYNGSQYTANPLTLGNDVVFPGSTTTQRVKIENNGNSTFYIRLSCSFQLYYNNAYQNTSEFLEISNIVIGNDSNIFVKSTVDDKYYYKGTLAAANNNNYIEDIDITFQISQSLGNSDLSNTINYQNIPYKIFLVVEVVQTANVTLNTNDVNNMATNWPSI